LLLNKKHQTIGGTLKRSVNISSMKDKHYFLKLLLALTLTELSYYFGSSDKFEMGITVFMALIFIVNGLLVNWHVKLFDKKQDKI
jgi:hypothetical protein